ncbi:unnamed protein product [Caenorhabditis auriculariae]|uniref:Uncharacterized protein n=1 Tax=Caenorhabditis auriculariae TaxID=2777116 RepID=A0A8S1HW73_9PELO|nr:unnamed protein product [Caenorhabditis auriculariae]
MTLTRTFNLCSRRLFSTKPNDYDLIVIGGGSGGLSCSKMAASLGAKVALVDAVEPTPSGVTWGIGGTCANVGCIPKKLMHHAAIVGKEISHAEAYGWLGVKKPDHHWHTLAKVVNDRIRANNWIYRVQLNEKGIKYINAFAKFVDKNEVHTTAMDKKKTERLLRAPKIVIATGLRPRYPNIEGAELGVTSDDLFSLPYAPGKTLVVGASYVALESAGLLADLGYEVHLMIRSIPLKGFDRDCVNKIVQNLKAHGVNIRWSEEVKEVSIENNRKKVNFKNAETGKDSSEDLYDTIIWAMGRDPNVKTLGLKDAHVQTSARSGRILADEFDRTTTEGIYAIGDVVEGRPELTPAAIRAGQLLAQRMFGGSKEITEYEKIATTVFTPLELSCVGMTEEQAVAAHGAENIEVYHSYFTPFEFIVPQDKDSEQCYLKVICMRSSPQEVLGLHFVGPNAAEVMQGFAVAFRKGLTYKDIVDTVAIHPCSAEEFVRLVVTKRSGLDPKVAGCCG